MEQETITLNTGETKMIQLSSRGASGLRLVFSMDKSGVVEVNRKEIKPGEEPDTLKIKPGDPVPAFFSIKGISKGQTSVTFSERPAGATNVPDFHKQTYIVIVN